jgi:hypothetical protein
MGLSLSYYPRHEFSKLTHSLKPGPARQVAPASGRPGAGTGSGLRKIEKVKTRVTVHPATRSKTRLQPINFYFFLLKRRCFDFLTK